MASTPTLPALSMAPAAGSSQPEVWQDQKSMAGATSSVAGGPNTTAGSPSSAQLAASSSSFKTVVADDASGLIAYTGWDPVGLNQVVVQPGVEDYAGTLSMTATANASAVVRFQGTSVTIIGVTAPPLGRISLKLDDQPDKIIPLMSNATTHNVPLFAASALAVDTAHQMTLTTLGRSSEAGSSSTVGGVGAVLDRVEISGPEGSVGFLDKDGSIVTPPPIATTPASPIPPPVNGTETGTGTGASTSTPLLPGATSSGGPNAGTIAGAVIGVLVALALLFWFFRRYGRPALAAKKEAAKTNAWDEANMLQNMKNEAVYITTPAKQRYVYPGLIAHSELTR